MGVAIGFAAGPADAWLSGSVFWRVMRLTGVVVLGAAVYFAALALMGFRPRDFQKRVG